MILRRLYLYLVSAAGIALLAIGLTLLGGTVLLFVFNDPSAPESRGSLAIYTAMTLVALPVWAIHFWFARRFAMRDPFERASAIRRLYLYLACLGFAVGATIALAVTFGDLLRPVLDSCTTTSTAILGKPGASAPACPPSQSWIFTSQAAWVVIVLLALWAFHLWVATRDFVAVGEEGASATLRRWYTYPALLIGMLMMLSGAGSTIAIGWVRALNSSLGIYQFSYLGDAVGLALAGALLWGFLARAIATRYVSDDRHSTLRTLEGFIAVAVGIATALFGASQILYYLLARALEVNNPGGVGNGDVLAGLAMPVSLLLVYGTAWILVRRRLARDAGTQEADRQAAIRRLYTNLACLVSLGAWGIGAGGLLWSLAEQLEARLIGVTPARWQDPVSLWVTLLVVGAAVWVANWRPSPWAADRQSLSRRLYVWAALLVSVLALLGAGVGMLNALLQQAFSPHPTLAASANLDFGHYLAVLVVAAAIGIYHWSILRADAATRPPKLPPHLADEEARVPAAAGSLGAAAPLPVAAPALVTAPAVIDAAPVHTDEVADPQARRYVLTVTDATEDDVHQALTSLPPQASYKLTRAEEVAGNPQGNFR